MNLAEKITDMNEYCDQETIAESLQIPKEIVKGVVDGTIDGNSLDEFDPSRPYELKLVKEDGLKVVEQKLDKIESSRKEELEAIGKKLEKIESKKTNKAKQIFSGIWGLMLDGIWFVALVICVSCAIYGLYAVGQNNGFENEIITKIAVFIQDICGKLTSLAFGHK